MGQRTVVYQSVQRVGPLPGILKCFMVTRTRLNELFFVPVRNFRSEFRTKHCAKILDFRTGQNSDHRLQIGAIPEKKIESISYES